MYNTKIQALFFCGSLLKLLSKIIMLVAHLAYKLLKLPTPVRCIEPWKFNISANKKGINLIRLV